MAEVTVDVDISEHLDECTAKELAQALSEEFSREEALAALKSVQLFDIENNGTSMNDLEDVIRAFCAGDSSSFEIALGNLFPNSRQNITFGLRAHPMKVAA